MSTLISKNKLEPIRHRFFISKKNKARRRLIRLGCGLTLALSDFRFVNMMRKMADDNNVSVQKIEDELDNLGFDLGPDVNIENILNIINNAVDNSIDMYAQYKGFWGLMDTQGKVIIDYNRGYTFIGSFDNGFTYEMKGYYGMCDATGKQISKIKVKTSKQTASVASSSNSSSSSSYSSNSSSGRSNNSVNNKTTIVIEHHRDPVPVQDWVPCSVCGHNPGVCQTCLGSRTTYSGRLCTSCGGTGKCHFCNGKGGRYQIVYR